MDETIAPASAISAMYRRQKSFRIRPDNRFLSFTRLQRQNRAASCDRTEKPVLRDRIFPLSFCP